jgi:hypothetical protein
VTTDHSKASDATVAHVHDTLLACSKAYLHRLRDDRALDGLVGACRNELERLVSTGVIPEDIPLSVGLLGHPNDPRAVVLWLSYELQRWLYGRVMTSPAVCDVDVLREQQ